MLKVCIADDHLLILNAVRAALMQAGDIDVVGAAHSGREVLKLVEQHEPDLVLLDHRMPDVDGLSCLKTIKQRWPQVQVVMLSASEDTKQIAEALDAGASAYIGKRINPQDLASALRQVVAGVVYQRSADSVEDSESAGAPDRGEELTKRERTLLEAVARGLSTKAISRELWISEKTVKFHLTNIYRKLGVHNRTGAMRYAFDHGLVTSRVDENEAAAASA
ncbi:MAG TPA: response regulator transcription factor [Solirubrobacteraceae bacterium]|nr:response regulator transcription factor [Solirubrobacteraceae bacterium]